jgi:hypothetical protein
MATRESYKPLTAGEGYLKWLPTLETSSDRGITPDDLLSAELWARDKVNIWLVRMAGPNTGQQIVTEFLNDANPIDPAIAHIAEIVASARISQTWEDRQFDSAGPDAQTQRRTYREILDEAIGLMGEIRQTGYTVKSNGTLRRLRLGTLQQGPIVAGPMSGPDSMFNDRGTFVDWNGVTRTLPHINPLDLAT